MDTSTAIHYAKLVSFPTAFFLSGYSLSYSQCTVPQLYDVRPQISTPIFKNVFYGGASVVVPGALLSSAASAFLAYAVPEHRRVWASAAAAVLFTQPWTALVMMPGIKRLLEISEANAAVQSKVEQTLEHRQLLKTWVAQNFLRAGLYFVGGLAGMYATLVA